MRVLLFIILGLFSVQMISADETKEAKVKELLQVMDSDAMIESMYDQMEMMLKSTSTQMGVQPNEKEIFDEYYSKMMNVMKSSINWEAMEPLMIELHNKHYTEEEISDMLEFYKTDTGRKIIKKMPVVMQESMLIGQSLVQQALPQIQALSAELAQELQKARAKSE